MIVAEGKNKFSVENADKGKVSEEEIDARRQELRREQFELDQLVSHVRAARDREYSEAVEAADGDHRKVAR